MANILIIEPNRILARTYAQALIHAGHKVFHAREAQEAIDVADEHNPDAVILELQLAAHDGIEFLHEFRSYPEWLKVPVILLTNVTWSALAPVYKVLQDDMGVVNCLYKPQTSLQKLISAVRVQLSHS